MMLERLCTVYTLEVAAAETTSKYLDIGAYSYGSLQTPAAFDTGNVTFEVTNDEDANGVPENWDALNDVLLVAKDVYSIAAGQCVPLPSEIFHFKYFRCVFATQSVARVVLACVKG